MWWNSMSALQQTAFIIACAASFVLVLQLIMLLIGGSADSDIGGGLTDTELSGGLTDGGLSDAGAFDGGANATDTDLSTDGEVSAGSHSGCAMAAALIGMEKMQGDGNLDPKNAIGKIGTVYLTVPPERSGKGKVNILIQERYAEYEAITNGSTALPTASEIKVVGYDGANVLIVEKHKKSAITIETE